FQEARQLADVANITKCTSPARVDARRAEQIRRRRGLQGKTAQLRAETRQKQGEPPTFETGVARNDNALAGPKRRRRLPAGGWCHVRHGARPPCHKSFSNCISR